jgi:hypothetical protein
MQFVTHIHTNFVGTGVLTDLAGKAGEVLCLFTYVVSTASNAVLTGKVTCKSRERNRSWVITW